MIWKKINGYENYYAVSESGMVKSLRKNKVLKPIDTRCGYLSVRLYSKNKSRWHLIHRLVACAFIENPKKKPHVNHVDGNKRNNKLENLEWVTRKENAKHAVDNGLYKNKFGEQHFGSKLNEKDVRKAIGLMLDRIILGEIENLTGINKKILSGINRHRAWKHLTKNLPNPIIDTKTSSYQKRIGRSRSKLSKEDITEIFRLRKKGLSQQLIADKFSVSQVYISQILKMSSEL